MTTRKGRTPASTPPDSEAADGRVRRPKPERTGHIRAAGGSASGPRAASKPADDETPDGSVSESVAQAVRMGYDVIAENIRQGREAAERFRLGEYNVRDAPGDLEAVLLRLIGLAREVSTTTLDVCERLLKEMGTRQPAGSEPPVPPFYSPTPEPKPKSSPPAEPGPPRMKLIVRFTGARKARAITEALDRPRRPARPEDLSAGPLRSRAGDEITDVRFEIDVSVEGLVALVALPDDIPAGIYAGMVQAHDDEVPLGELTVEVAA
jgi:hypothetical protein